MVYLDKALIMCVTHFGSECIEAAVLTNNIGILYSKMSMDNHAIASFEKAAIIFQSLEDTDDDIQKERMLCQENISAFYLQHLDDETMKYAYDKAESALLKVLAFRECDGPHHPLILAQLNALGCLYRKKNDYSRAQLFYEKALLTAQHVYEIPYDTKICPYYEQLGRIHFIQARYEQARSHFNTVQLINLKYYSADHPDVLRTQNNIAMVELTEHSPEILTQNDFNAN